TLGAGQKDIIILIIKELRIDLMVNVVTAFSRAISEVGAVMLVGGNIRYRTRVITTTISMMKSMGDYPMAIALGIVLLLISFIVNSLIYKYTGDD
ncbi:MAG: tungstate transporter permease, partial [Tissierellales bacterium]